MFVLKRNGRKETVKFDKITARIEKLCYGLNPALVDPIDVAKKVIEGLFDGVNTSELDNLAAETAASGWTRSGGSATAPGYRRWRGAARQTALP